MIKKIFLGIIVLVVLVIGGTFLYLDSIVKNGIEIAGSRVLGTPVLVDSVGISPLSGSGSISGLTIGNPDGYSTENAFELGEISIALNTGSIMSDVIKIDSIIIDSPHINYETDIRTDNIRTLLANINTGGEAQPETAAEGGGKNLLIRDLQLNNSRLDLITAVASAPVVMPDIRLTDIGTGGNGATAEEVIRLILSRINQAIIAGNIPGVAEYRERAQERLQEAESEAREAIDDAVEDIGGRLRDILN